MLSFSFQFGTDDALGLTCIDFSAAQSIGLTNDNDPKIYTKGPITAIGGWKPVSCVKNNTLKCYTLNLSDERIPMGWMCHLVPDSDNRFYLFCNSL